MRAGANDYLMKGNMKRLVPTVEREINQTKLRRDHRQSEEMVKHLAYHDSLTALPNRTLLHDRLQASMWSRASGLSFIPTMARTPIPSFSGRTWRCMPPKKPETATLFMRKGWTDSRRRPQPMVARIRLEVKMKRQSRR